MKKGGLLGLLLAVVMSLSMIGVIPAKAEMDVDFLERLLYEPTGEHLYTTNHNESGLLQLLGWNYEGVACWVAKYSDNPVYRLVYKKNGMHHYTTSIKERDNLSRNGWNYEGIAFYSEGEVPIYRLFHPKTGNRHYTASAKERDYLSRNGWRAEGVAWYGLGEGGGSFVDDRNNTNQNQPGKPDKSIPISAPKSGNFDVNDVIGAIEVRWDYNAAENYYRELDAPYDPGLDLDLKYNGSYMSGFEKGFGVDYDNATSYYYTDSYGNILAAVMYAHENSSPSSRIIQAGALIFSDEIELNISFCTGPFGGTSVAECDSRVYGKQNNWDVRNPIIKSQSMYRSYTGAWLYGICSYRDGKFYDYDSSWIAQGSPW